MDIEDDDYEDQKIDFLWTMGVSRVQEAVKFGEVRYDSERGNCGLLAWIASFEIELIPLRALI